MRAGSLTSYGSSRLVFLACHRGISCCHDCQVGGEVGTEPSLDHPWPPGSDAAFVALDCK